MGDETEQSRFALSTKQKVLLVVVLLGFAVTWPVVLAGQAERAYATLNPGDAAWLKSQMRIAEEMWISAMVIPPLLFLGGLVWKRREKPLRSANCLGMIASTLLVLGFCLITMPLGGRKGAIHLFDHPPWSHGVMLGFLLCMMVGIVGRKVRVPGGK